MNPLKALNEMLRKPQTATVRVTATTQSGETKSTEAVVKLNKLNTLGGTGLTGQSLYELIKHGRCETSDWMGTKFVFEVVQAKGEQVEEKKGAENEKST